MKLGNIIYEDELINHKKSKIINYVEFKNLSNVKIDNNLPTLIVGWKLVKEILKESSLEISILEKRIVTNKLYWEHSFEDEKEEYFVEGDIDITKYDVGDKFALESLHFIGGRHKLLPESMPPLKNLLKVMKENPTLHILIIGHICCEPDISIDGYDYDTHTQNLSYNRAKEIYEYLVRNGIDGKRMDFKGMGGKEKIYPYETTEEQRTANRRVEIEVVEM